jgi:uncharacterized protein (TIGR03437 family)
VLRIAILVLLPALAQAQLLRTISVTRLGAGVQITAYAQGPQGEHLYSYSFGSSSFLVLQSGLQSSIRPLALPPGAAVTSLATDPAGNLYIAGTVVQNNRNRAFVQKSTGNASQVYLTYIGGEASTSTRSMAVTREGDVLLNGQVVGDGFPITPDTPNSAQTNTGFLVKLNPEGQVTTALRGVPYGLLALDPSGSIYLAGSGGGIAPTPDAFQSSVNLAACGGTGLLGIACPYQQIWKLSPDARRIEYATYLAGSFGASPTAIEVDALGQVTVAGTTHSPDYPTTPDVLQPDYRATQTPSAGQVGRPTVIPPAESGYISKLSADGSALVWSTYFSGTGADSIAGLVTKPDGSLSLIGFTASHDPPGAPRIPDGCSPRLRRPLPLLATLSPNGRQLESSRILWSLVGQGIVGFTVRDESVTIVTQGSILTSSLPTVELPEPAACFLDPADWTTPTALAPGQLLTIFGDFGDAPTSASVNGVAAPLLFASPQQVNFQVPREIASEPFAAIEVQTPEGSLQRSFAATPRSPAVLLREPPLDGAAPEVNCNGVGLAPAYVPIADNEDGTLQSCENPASPGSLITLYVNGVALSTAVVRLREGDQATIETFEPAPNAIGLYRLRLRLLPDARTGTIGISVDGTPTRYGPFVVFVAR